MPDQSTNDNIGKDAANLSTEHQAQGDAKRPNDQLDRNRTPPEDDGGRKTSFTHND